MNPAYIIGEIGQNHNGSVDIAKLIVDLVVRPISEDIFNIQLPPIDAIKLVKRDLNAELSDSMKARTYDSPHSFGRTYGEHRSYLELEEEEHFEIYKYAKSKGLDVVETLCAIGALKLLKYFHPDRLKVASRDLTNLPLIEALAETKIPIILSTGMAGKEELDNALDIIVKYHDNISILHCVSEYPTNPKNANLLSISYLIQNYPEFTIGYSDHTIGISAPIAAIALGAKIIEKHITIDRRMKGTDQINSLGPDGVYRMIRDIRITEISLGRQDIFIDPAVQCNRIKLERSIASKVLIPEGEIIRKEMLHLLSPGDGFQWKDINKIINKKAAKDINANEIIYPDFLK